MIVINWFDLIFSILNLGVLVATAYFIYRSINSPIEAVKVGRDLNTEESKDKAKRNLFLMLFSLRGNPTHYDFVRGLNQIDIVFEDSPSVLAAWHSHYQDLNNERLTDPSKIWEIGRVRMLSAMAVSLRYGKLEQASIMEYYTPQGHVNQLNDDLAFREAALVFLRSGAAMNQMIIERMDKNDQAPIVEEK